MLTRCKLSTSSEAKIQIREHSTSIEIHDSTNNPRYFVLDPESEAKRARGCKWCTITPLSGNGNGNGIVSAELEASENFVVCAASKGRKIQNHLICGIARSSKVPDCCLHRIGSGALKAGAAVVVKSPTPGDTKPNSQH